MIQRQSSTVSLREKTKYPQSAEQQRRRTKQRWDPTVCQDTADDNDNDTSCQMPVPCRAKGSLTPKKKKRNEQKLTVSSLRTHEVSALEASSSRNCRYLRPSPDPPAGARRHRLVCPGTGHAQRAEILPFRNASGRFLSQRGCVVEHYQLRPN